MKSAVLIVCVLAIATVISCGKDNITPVPDPAIQRAIDVAIIDEYLKERGFTDVDTTDSGVRYVILDDGDGEAIDESDNVTFNYTGKLLNDTIFDTSIKAVVDSIRNAVSQDSIGLEDKSEHHSILFNIIEKENDTPLKVTFSATGWPFTSSFVQGFEDGIIASFNSKREKSARIGGKVLIAVPSDLAYGVEGRGYFIDPNTPILFELFPISVSKQ